VWLVEGCCHRLCWRTETRYSSSGKSGGWNPACASSQCQLWGTAAFFFFSSLFNLQNDTLLANSALGDFSFLPTGPLYVATLLQQAYHKSHHTASTGLEEKLMAAQVVKLSHQHQNIWHSRLWRNGVMSWESSDKQNTRQDGPIFLPLSFVCNSYCCFMKKRHNKSKFQGTDTLLQREIQCKMAPKCICKAWSLSLGCLGEMYWNPIAMATPDLSDPQSFHSTGAKTVLFSKGKMYLCLPSFAL
jgi:hypothetical protein